MSIISVLLLIIALISIASLGFSLLVISGEYTFLSRRNGYLLGIFILIILSGGTYYHMAYITGSGKEIDKQQALYVTEMLFLIGLSGMFIAQILYWVEKLRDKFVNRRRRFVNRMHIDALKELENMVRSNVEESGKIDSIPNIVEMQPVILESSDEQLNESFEKQLLELRRKIEQLSSNPTSNTIDERVAFSNDVILTAYIQDLRVSLNRLESKVLSKWDVAKVVVTIVLAFVAAGTFVIRLISTRPPSP
jgi:hypothetical protein